MVAHSTMCGLVVLGYILRGLSIIQTVQPAVNQTIDQLPNPNAACPQERQRLSESLKYATKQAHDIFIGEAILFQLCLAIAGLATLWHNDSFYNSAMTEHGILLATLSVLSLLLMKQSLDWISPFIGALLIVISILLCAFIETTIIILFRFGPDHYSDGHCIQAHLEGPFQLKKVRGMAISLGFLPLLVVVLSVKHVSNRLPTRFQNIWKYFHELLLLGTVATTCVVLYFMWAARANVQAIAVAPGGSNWTFGQILAALVWIAVPISFIVSSSKLSNDS